MKRTILAALVLILLVVLAVLLGPCVLTDPSSVPGEPAPEPDQPAALDSSSG